MQWDSVVRTVSSKPMARYVMRLLESVMCWNTAVGILLTALLISISKMATAAAITSHTASLACAAVMMNNAAFTGDQVLVYINVCCKCIYMLEVL